MYCKDCKFRKVSSDDNPICRSEFIRELSVHDEDGDFKQDGSRLLYCYEESGKFYVEDYFGCVHFEEKKDDGVLYGCGYDMGDGSYGMFAGPSSSLLDMESYLPDEPENEAVIIRLSDSVVIRRWVNGGWTNTILP